MRDTDPRLTCIHTFEFNSHLVSMHRYLQSVCSIFRSEIGGWKAWIRLTFVYTCEYNLCEYLSKTLTNSKNRFKSGTWADKSWSNTWYIHQSAKHVLISCGSGAHRGHHARTKCILFWELKDVSNGLQGFVLWSIFAIFKCLRKNTKMTPSFLLHFGPHFCLQNRSEID